ncbi:hypothetical protein C6P45_004115 [Maudiozyma exigua]|uniref:Flavodoxin-like fold domain-containing protein n=1 Tax=Maudiozyma exigua TaxID=34358 RepID=A0A9P6WEH1_MAUEX|nr:hypothetical protein C6P45_004115 [Kazachstania exigua]
MKVLFIFAHPDKRSFNYSLLDAAVSHLKSNGHEVQVSDLYRMNWKGIVTEDDFLNHEKGTRLKVVESSTKAYQENQLTQDVVLEQEKLKWADMVIFQFPLWWFTMPAILKGWFDRVFTSGYAYNVGTHTDTRYGDRYGEGIMAGKKAFCIITAGGREEHFSERGINGDINDLIFPINHGMLFYPGFTVLPPVLIFRVDSRRETVYQQAERDVLQRMDDIETIKPINYRKQNFGDYAIPELRLKDGVENSTQTHFDIHIKQD